MNSSRVVLAAALLIPSLVGAQLRPESDTVPRIVVSASRSARLVPDRASLFATVEGSAETPTDAVRRVQQKLEAVLAAVRELGATAETPVAVPYNVSPVVNQGGYPQAPSPLPYMARFAVKLTPRRLDQLQQLAAAAIGAGAASTSGPMFESSAADSARRALVVEAIRQAQREADQIAESLGGRRGSLVDVTAGGAQNFGFQSNTITFSNRFDSGQSAAPEVQVSANVTVRYRLAR